MRERNPPPLKVSFVYDGDFSPTSGVGKYVYTLGEYLEDRGHGVSYLVGSSSFDNKGNVHALGRSFSISSNGNQQYVALPVSKGVISDLLRDSEPDVLHVQATYNPFFGGRVLKQAKPDTGIVATFHPLPQTREAMFAARSLGFINRRTMALIEHAFSATEALKAHVRRTFSIDSELMPLPINADQLRGGSKIPEYDDGRVNLFFIGRLEPRKGCTHLLGALSLMKSEVRKDLRLLVAGDGYLRMELEAQAKRDGLDDTVKFLGFVEESQKPTLFKTADIVTLPAIGCESFGLVVAEAMAGTNGIVVGGNNLGYSEVLGHNTETLFDPLDPMETARFLTNLIRDEEKRARIRQFQQQLVKNYDIKTIGPKIEAAYFRVLAKKQQL